MQCDRGKQNLWGTGSTIKTRNTQDAVSGQLPQGENAKCSYTESAVFLATQSLTLIMAMPDKQSDRSPKLHGKTVFSFLPFSFQPAWSC